MVAMHYPEPVAAPLEPAPALVDGATGFDGGFFLPLAELVVETTYQTRRDRDPEVVAAMRASMEGNLKAQRHPQETPVWVMRRNTQWVLLAGFTRYELLTALAGAGGDSAYAQKPTIWCLPKSAPTPYRAILENIRENMDRQALSVADQAEAYARLQHEDPSRSLAAIARDVGRSVESVQNLVRATKNTTPEMWGAFRRKAISQKEIIKLGSIKDPEEQRAAYEAMFSTPTDAQARAAKRAEKKAETEAKETKIAQALDVMARLKDIGEKLDPESGTHSRLSPYGYGMRDLYLCLLHETPLNTDAIWEAAAPEPEGLTREASRKRKKKPEPRAKVAPRKRARKGR